MKAEQEAKLRSADTTRKLSSESNNTVRREEQKYSKPKTSASVRVTVRSTANPSAEEKRSKDDMSLSTQKNATRISEDFFTPPNKQSYVEYKTTAKTMHTTSSATTNTTKPVSLSKPAAEIDFDLMSELDDLINYDPNAHPTTKKKTVIESKATTEVASDLLNQLQNLEDEMKMGGFSEEEQQLSRRSSNSSVNSKSSGMYATVNKKPHPSSSISSVPGMSSSC